MNDATCATATSGRADAEMVAEMAPTPTKPRRRYRRREIRSRTLNLRRLSKRKRAELFAFGRSVYPEEHWRPRTRAECAGFERPCSYVSCKFHLYLDVNPDNGSIKLNFPDLEVWELAETCVLDVAERGGVTLEEVGDLMNMTRERIRQVEQRALDCIRESREAAALREYH